jgi:hypothetical protein
LPSSAKDSIPDLIARTPMPQGGDACFCTRNAVQVALIAGE